MGDRVSPFDVEITIRRSFDAWRVLAAVVALVLLVMSTSIAYLFALAP